MARKFCIEVRCQHRNNRTYEDCGTCAGLYDNLDEATKPGPLGSAVLPGCEATVADAVDRLLCMANEKELQIKGPYLSDILKDSAQRDATVLRKAAAMFSAYFAT